MNVTEKSEQDPSVPKFSALCLCGYGYGTVLILVFNYFHISSLFPDKETEHH